MKVWRRLIHCTRSNDELSSDGMNLEGVRHAVTFVMRYNTSVARIPFMQRAH